MYLINVDTLELEEFMGGTDLPKYAILSHTWEDQEVSFALFADPRAKSMKGYTKIINACRQAQADGYKHIWVDTCCIDKSSSAELSEAINSMFAWYKKADVCYAYLADVDEKPDSTSFYDESRAMAVYPSFAGRIAGSHLIRHPHFETHKSPDQFSSSRWFKRGWTLQELIAPRDVIFFSRNWLEIARRNQSCETIAYITGIDSRYLSGEVPVFRASTAERMFWASSRTTTRLEDIAYCLLGIFDTNMPLLYGEGEKAFQRLQEEILRYSDDHTIFAWTDDKEMYNRHASVLARHPQCFARSRGFVPYPRLDGDSSVRMINTGLELRLWRVGPDATYAGNANYPYALNCTSELQRKGSIVIYLRKLEHSAGAYGRVNRHKLGYSESTNTEVKLLVDMDRAEHLKRQVWTDAVVYLERGPDPSRYPLVNIASAQYRRVYGEEEELLNAPILRIHTTADNFLHRSRLNRLGKRAGKMKWVNYGMPETYDMPVGGDLVAVALEFRTPCSRRIIIMVGTSVKHDVGFDCLLLSENDETRLENCGRYYNPKNLGYQCVLSPYIVQVCGHTEFHKGLRTTEISIFCRATELSNDFVDSLKESPMTGV